MTTPTTGLLRGMVVTNAALFLLEFGSTLGYVLLTSVPEQETLGVASPEVGTFEIFACFVLVVFVPTHFAGLLGLLLLRNWGRWLNLGTLAFFNGLNLLASVFDVSTAWGFPAAVSQVEAIVSGLILGLAFYSPLSREFAAVDATAIH